MKMRSTNVILILASALVARIEAQQHHNANNGLYGDSARVADSEVPYWKHEDPKPDGIDLPLYASSSTHGQRASQPNVQSTVTPTGTGPERPWYYQKDVLKAPDVAAYNTNDDHGQHPNTIHVGPDIVPKSFATVAHVDNSTHGTASDVTQPYHVIFQPLGFASFASFWILPMVGLAVHKYTNRFFLSSKQRKGLFWVTLADALVSTLFLGGGTNVSTAEGRYVPLSLWTGLEIFYVGRVSTKLNKPNFYMGFVALVGAALTAVYAAVFGDKARSWAANFMIVGPIMVTVWSVCTAYSLAYFDPKYSTGNVAPATGSPSNNRVAAGSDEAGDQAGFPLQEFSPYEADRRTSEDARRASGVFALTDTTSSPASSQTDLTDDGQPPAFALSAEDLVIAGLIPSPWADAANTTTDEEHGLGQAQAAPKLSFWARIKRTLAFTRR